MAKKELPRIRGPGIVEELRLVDLRLIRANTFQDADFADDLPDQVDSLIRVTPQQTTENELAIDITPNVSASGPNKGEKIFHAEATFRLIYEFREGPGDFGDVAIQQMAWGVALFDAWPFWREFLQSTLARMSLPPLLVPMLHPEGDDFVKLVPASKQEVAAKPRPKKGRGSGAKA